MNRTGRTVFAAGFMLVVISSGAFAENWPGWRGPRGDGTSQETSVPVKWNGETGENIAWKVKIPGTGHSCPVVWDDHIYLGSCNEETQERLLLCFHRSDGHVVWQRTVTTSKLETRHQLNSFASATPATDGETVYITFLITDGHEVPAPNVGSPRNVTPGEVLVAAYSKDGEEKWKTTTGDFISAHGFCSSPVIYKNLLIINGDHDGESWLTALDRETGKVVWRIPRDHKIRSYCTPIIRDIGGHQQMVLSGSKHVISLDPETGKQFWRVEGPTEQFVSSMVFDRKRFFLTSGYPDHYVMAIRPDGTGDVTATHVQWKSDEAKCYVPSPVLCENRLFVADDRGTVNCFDTETGRRIFQDRLGNHYSASLLTANGLVYFTADDGNIAVVRPGEELDIVSKNPLGEYCWSSPAISDGRIYVRGEHHLFAIGNRP